MNARTLSTDFLRRWLPALVIFAYLVMPGFSLASSATAPELVIDWLYPQDPEEGFGG
jgi:hypothetical protein